MKRIAVFVIAALAGAPSIAAEDAHDTLLQPIVPEFAQRWLVAQPPAKIYGNTYLVGFEGLNVALIDTGDGLVLIDGALPQAVPAIKENLRALGFRIEDVRLILSTEPHYDHASGIAALARDSGATVVAGVAAVDALRSGESDPHDPQHGLVASFHGIGNVRGIDDRETITLGNTTITAIATPGHTRGSTSWTWQACVADQCRNVVFASSVNPVSADDYRFSAPGHEPVVRSFRETFRTLRALPCDIFFQSHSGTPLKNLNNGGPSPCSDYASRYESILDARLADEARP